MPLIGVFTADLGEVMVIWKQAMVALAAMLLMCVAPVCAETYVYVSVAGEKRIAVYAAHAENGTLEKRGDAVLRAEPGALAVDPGKQFLFASLRSAGRLASFRIDGQTGMLTQASNVPADADPAYVATDRSGRYLLSAYYVAGRVMVHGIAADGSLSESPIQTVVTDEKAHAILTDASNRWAFVPHTGPHAIFQFRFDPDTGALTANSPARVFTGEQTGPRHAWFHPRRAVVYFDNEQGSSVTAYRMDKHQGTLSPLETWSTLPDGYDRPNSCAAMRMTPDGRFLYAANRGHDSIAGFAVDEESGLLTSLGQASTEATPRSFDIDATGRFLYAAGQSTGKLAAFRIDGDTGRLQRFATYAVGTRPWWVMAVSLPERLRNDSR